MAREIVLVAVLAISVAACSSTVPGSSQYYPDSYYRYSAYERMRDMQDFCHRYPGDYYCRYRR